MSGTRLKLAVAATQIEAGADPSAGRAGSGNTALHCERMLL